MPATTGRLDQTDAGRLVGDIPNGYFLPPLLDIDTYKAVAHEVMTEAEFLREPAGPWQSVNFGVLHPPPRPGY